MRGRWLGGVVAFALTLTLLADPVQLTVLRSRSDIAENKIKTALDWYSNFK